VTKRFTIETKTTTSRGARRRTWTTYAVKQIDAEGWTLSIGFAHPTYAAAKAELDRKVQAEAVAARDEAAFQEYFWNLNKPDQGFPVDEQTARAMFARHL